ncbi:MAG TPA: Crp/Fnr family transcriptional regulator [Rugosimonospora sp.]|nr:Crp/Fnr family transcriptional regulator [Rugosimonospora sp.]
MRSAGDFWELLTPDEAAELERRGTRRRYRRGAVIFREAERGRAVVVLLAGRVKITSNTASGTEVVLAVRGPGALLGELSALDGGAYSATVQALEPVTALVTPVAEFSAYLQARGRVGYLLMRMLVGRLRDADRKRIEFGAHDTTGRVAARLLELAERFGQPSPEGITIALPLSQDELAGWTGASRESVSKALGALRGEGAIRTSRLRVVVRDVEKLRQRVTR